MAWRIVGRETPSWSAQVTSLAMRSPATSSPSWMARSSCSATWKYSGTGLERLSTTSG